MRRKYRDREMIAEVCSKRTAIKDNQRAWKLHPRSRPRWTNNPVSQLCLLWTVPLPPVSPRLSPWKYPLAQAVRKWFSCREKAISREYETRELSLWMHLRAKRIKALFSRALLHCATLCSLSKENIYRNFLYVNAKQIMYIHRILASSGKFQLEKYKI